MTVKKRLLDGAQLTGSWLTFASPTVAEALGHQGFDCIFTSDLAFMRKSRQVGYTLISLSADALLLARGAKAFREAFEA